MVALPLLLCALSAAPAPPGAAAAESAFLKALSKRDGTEKERR